MLTSSWGSCSTTTTLTGRSRRSRGRSSDELQDAYPLGVLSIAAQPDPAIAPAPDELSRASHAVGEHLVNQQVEADLGSDVRAVLGGPADGEGHAISSAGAAPGAPHRVGRAGRVARSPHPHRAVVGPFGADEGPDDA